MQVLQGPDFLRGILVLSKTHIGTLSLAVPGAEDVDCFLSDDILLHRHIHDGGNRFIDRGHWPCGDAN